MTSTDMGGSPGTDREGLDARSHRVGGPHGPALDALASAVEAMVLLPNAPHGPGHPEGAAAADLLVEIDRLVGRLQVAEARLLTVVEADGWWAVDGARSVTTWLTGAAPMSHARARQLVTTGRALRDDLPVTADAAADGVISPDHVQALVRHATTSDRRCEALHGGYDECGEPFLLAQARLHTPDTFRRIVRRWASAADPDADERGHREATDREFLDLADTTGGVHLSGFLTTEHGAGLRSALEAVMRAPLPDDMRTTSQRRAQALSDLARLALDRGLTDTSSGVRPRISCVVDLDTLRRALAGTRPTGHARAQAGSPPGDEHPRNRPPEDDRAGPPPDPATFHLRPIADIERFAVAELHGAGPIPRSVLARLACDSDITRVVFGATSQVINVGRAERTYTGARRRAIIARDHTCRYGDCGAPASLSELHHIDHWGRDHGETDTDRGVLLCWYHHDLVHRLGIEIERSAIGGWTFTRTDGTTVERGA